VRDSIALRDLHAEIDALDTRIAGHLQLELYAIVQGVLVDRIGWTARNLAPAAGLVDIVSHYRAALAELTDILPGLLARDAARAVRHTESRLKAGHVPEGLAARLAMLPVLARASDVVLIADRTGRSLGEAAQSFFGVGERFGFGRLDAMIHEIPPADYYDALALQKARDSLEAAQRDLAHRKLANGADLAGTGPEASLDGRAAITVEQVEKILADRRPSTAKATVAASLLSELARG
jgi:glutamate dehydrogenase